MSTRDIYAGVVATNNTSTSSPSSEDNPTTVHFSSHVDQALQELLPSNDVFDSPHFDAVDYINQLFPNEQALNDNLDTFILKVKRKIVRVDEEIITAVRRQSSAGAQASRDLEEAKNVIYNLYSKIQDIKGKAEQSEAMVQKITKDIKELDYGKKHITTTISALEGLHELVTAIDALKELKIKQDYKQVAKKLQVVNSLVTKFEKYQDIAKILRLIGEVNTIKLELKEQILKDFQSWERHDQEGTSVTKLLSAACEVVDALGNEARQKLISQFTNQQITLYKMIFSQKKKAAFDNILKRYNWMRKLLAKYEDKYADIFPEDWCVRQELVVEFCLATRDDIVNLLNANKGCMDPTVLYRSILNTTQFEREMHDRFHVSSQEEIKMETQQAQVKVTEELEQLVPQEKTADAIKRKFKLLLRQRQIEQQMKRVAVEDLPDRAPKKAVKPQKDYKFLGFISSCFDDHMDTYINYESKELTAALEGYCKKEEWSEDGETKSHESLFMYISSSIKSCTALSKGKVLLSLIENVWKKHLNKYAAFISDSLPRIQSLGTVQAKDSFMEKMDMRKWIPNTENNNNTTDKQLIVNFTEDEENKVCYMIHIATFCLDNIETMQDDLRALMEEPYASQVDLSEETNKFYVVLKSAVEQLVLNLMITVEAEFKKMTLLPLATVTEVGDQSEYVTSMISFLSDAFPYLAGKIPLNNFKYLCDSFVLSLFHSYMTNIYKCKKINGTGAQQLLLDVTSLTTFLKFIINLGDSTRFDEEELHTFAKKVQSKSTKLECTLKVLLAPTESLVDTYRGLIPDGSAQDFNIILDLKGLTKNEKSTVLDQYNRDSRKNADTSDLVGKTMQETAKLMEKMKNTFTF